jgi:hypothetical protein
MLESVQSQSGNYFSIVRSEISGLSFNKSKEEEISFQQLKKFLDSCLDSEILRIQQNEINNKLATLQTRILLEMTDIIESTHRLYHLYKDFIMDQGK